MKKDRNCGMTPYPVYPPYQPGMQPGMQPMNMQGMQPMNMQGMQPMNMNTSPFLSYPNQPGMGMMPNNPAMTGSSTNIGTNVGVTIEDQLNSINNQINNLDRRITNLETVVGNTNMSSLGTKYNTSNYQMM